jgi:lipopolysaccharide export system ATP-binding protein
MPFAPMPVPALSPTAPATPATAQIEAKDLHKVFGQREVVRGINLRVSSGEIVGLLGPNGAGKTTTFYMIVGLVDATRGRVQLGGTDITKMPMYRRARLGLGYLPQEPSVFRKLTVWQNIQAIVETLPLPREQQAPLIESLLKELHLFHLAKQMAFTLSGGERRRLEITRALVVRPRFLLLDEPFSGVDPISVREVQDLVVGLKAKGIGVLITDHNVRETLRIVDRAYIINEGKVLCEGTSEFLVNDEQSRRFYLGADFKL